MKFFKTVVYYIVCSILKLLSFVFYPCKVVGLENIPKDRQFIICANHISMLDIVVLNMVYMRPMHYMAKAELFKNKILGAFFGFFGAFPVNRGTGDMGAIEHAQNLLKDDKPMCIFIEGTRTKNKDGSPGRAKSGAVVIASKVGCDVVPIAIVYKHGRPRIFSSTTIYFGESITSNELQINDNSRADIRKATTLIMDKITEMWKAGTEQCRK